MKRNVWLVFSAILSLATLAQAASINVGTRTLQPNQANQTVDLIIVPGGTPEELLGLDFGVALGDASNSAPSNDSGPIITSVDFVSAITIFGPNNIGVIAGSEIDFMRLRAGSTVTNPASATQVLANGILARLTISTVGVPGRIGQDLLFPLVLDNPLATTVLSDTQANNPLSIQNGFVRIAALVPEPATLVLGSLGGLAGLVAVGRRWKGR
jgi:hypothetical protein